MIFLLTLVCLLLKFQFINSVNYLKENFIRAIFFIALIFLTNCTIQHQKKTVITKINLIISYPFIQPSDFKLINLKDTIPIYYFENIILYKLPLIRSFENDKEILNIEKDYTYFIFYSGSEKGLWFDSNIDIANGVPMSVDSVLKKRGYKTDFSRVTDSLLYINTKRKQDTIFETYWFKYANNERTFDSVYLYFNKDFNNIHYSFSNKLDSTRGAKLFKVRLLFNEKFSETYRSLFPKREFLFEIQKDYIKNKNEEKEFEALIALLK